MANSKIPYGRQSINYSDIESVCSVLSTDFLTTGPKVTAFEDNLCEITGALHAIACCNGTAALHLACMALELQSNSFGITTPITFLASANCFEFCGTRTGFVDIDGDTLCLSPQMLETYCKNVRVPDVVVAVDFAGVPADLPALWDLASKYGFRLIEDAAHSLGSSYTHEGKDFLCGSCQHADLATLSFHPVKTITTGEGGAVLTNDTALAERLRLLRNHGMTKDPMALTRNDGGWYYEMHVLGYNYRITDVQCALGISQLSRLFEFKERRQKIVQHYNNAFEKESALITPRWPEATSPCFHLYPIQFREGPETRKKAYDELQKKGIYTQVHYVPVYWQPYYRQRYGYNAGMCPNSEHYYERCLSLPLYPAMTDSEVEYVVSSLLECVLKND